MNPRLQASCEVYHTVSLIYENILILTAHSTEGELTWRSC